MMKGQGFMGLIFVIIIAIGVAVPIAATLVTAANLSGTDATIAGFTVTLLLVAVLSLIARAGGIA